MERCLFHIVRKESGMDQPRNGFEYLKLLQEKKDITRPSFNDFESYLDYKAREKGIPVTGQFELTPLCNLSCRMCYVHLTKEQMNHRSVLTTQEWKHLMGEACKAGMYKATLSGGECLTYPGFQDLYLYLQGQGCRITVLTNGRLLDEKRVRFFQENPPASIRITLYGYDEESYERVTGVRCFQEVCDHIRLVTDAGLPLTVSVTPNRFLGEGVFQTMRTARSLCEHLMISNALFDPREETGRAGQEADLSLEDYCRIHRLKNELDGIPSREIPEEQLPEPGGPCHEASGCGLRCGGGQSGFSIDWRGIMHPCERLQDIEADPMRDGFLPAWETLHKAASDWPQVPECDGCPYFPTCIQCAAYMRTFTAPGKQPVELCRRTKYLVQHGVWRIPECS